MSYYVIHEVNDIRKYKLKTSLDEKISRTSGLSHRKLAISGSELKPSNNTMAET